MKLLRAWVSLASPLAGVEKEPSDFGSCCYWSIYRNWWMLLLLRVMLISFLDFYLLLVLSTRFFVLFLFTSDVFY